MSRRQWMITFLIALVLSVGLVIALALNWSNIAPNPQPIPQKNDSITNKKNNKRPIILYYIAVSDNGQNGQSIGCDDSAVPVVVDQVETDDIVKTTFERLLSDKDRDYDSSALYNALYNSDLSFVNSEKNDNSVTVNLSGDFNLGGVCDAPRVQAQLELTAMTAANVEKVEIFVDSEPLSDVLSLR